MNRSSFHMKVQKRKYDKLETSKEKIIFSPIKSLEISPRKSITPLRYYPKKVDKSASPKAQICSVHMQPILKSHEFIEIHRSISPFPQDRSRGNFFKMFMDSQKNSNYLSVNKYKKYKTPLSNIIKSKRITSKLNKQRESPLDIISTNPNTNNKILII